MPILPHPLIEMLEAPVPFLAGITKKEYKDMTLTQEERSQKIWVFLEKGVIHWLADGTKLPTLNFDSMDQRIKNDYLKFEKA